MAVQAAQYPSNILLSTTDCIRKKPRQSTNLYHNAVVMDSCCTLNPSPVSSLAAPQLGTVEDPPQNYNLLNFYSSASLMAQPQHTAINSAHQKLHEVNCNTEAMINASSGVVAASPIGMSAMTRKRSRDVDQIQQQHQQQQYYFNPSLAAPLSYQGQQNRTTTGPFVIPQLPISTGSTGLSQIVDESVAVGRLRRPMSAAGTIVDSTSINHQFDRANTVASNLSPPPLPLIFSPQPLCNDITTQYVRQNEEIDQLIAFQAEKLRQVLAEKRQQQTRAMVAFMEEGACKRIKEKEEEVERVNRRNVALEERLNQLAMESQLWQNVARKNEAMVCSLRSSLEHVVAEQTAAARTCCGESSVDDAQSCNEGGQGFGSAAAAAAATPSSSLRQMANCHAGGRSRPQAEAEAEANIGGNSRLCRVCGRNSVCVLVLPCKHLCLCRDCDSSIAPPHCPICKAPKDASILVYMD